MEFVKQFDKRKRKGEDYTGVLKVTQPGQSFTTREIYERFLVTGRVAGAVREAVYDSDELQKSPDQVSFDDFDVMQKPDLDMSDVSEHRQSLTNSQAQRKEINRLSLQYSLGKITYDEFCNLARKQNPDYAQPLIEMFGKKLNAAKLAEK